MPAGNLTPDSFPANPHPGRGRRFLSRKRTRVNRYSGDIEEGEQSREEGAAVWSFRFVGLFIAGGITGIFSGASW
jgi:hypothetical protein